MRIAIIGSKGVPATYGGVERHVEELAKGLVKKGHSVTVYSRQWYTKYDKDEYEGIKIKNIRSIKSKNLDTITYAFLATVDALKSHDFDIIHYQGVGPSLLSFIPRIFSRKVKVVATFHCEDYKHEKWGFFAKFMLKLGERASAVFPHKTITVSKILQDKVKNVYNREAEYIPNGVEIKDLKTIYENYEIYNKFKIERGKYIVVVTRLVRHKGVHLIVEAYKMLPEAVKNEYKLVIVGGSLFNDDYEKELKDMIRGEKNIVMTGTQTGNDLQTLYMGAKLFVHASSTEGLPIALLEASNYGKPVLVSDIPEHLEVIGKDRGFTFRNGDVDDLRLKLETLLDKDKEKELKEVAINAKKFVEKEYNWDDIVTKTEKLYEDVLSGKTQKAVIRGVARI
ncbi:MAG TPA: glycosyltransferase family 4 protein [bacterium]|nr:glycosyltransferase family 4 protein [bacterium]